MIARLLIANRGEIACRIMRTARRMGIGAVLAASEADRNSRAAAMADAVEVIGPAPAAESYLRADLIIAAAQRQGCDAIHPGYGFLSESAAFAEAVEIAGLVFVGPTADAMRRLGGKSAAKALAISCGVPVVPGFHGDAQDNATLIAEARRIGFPMLVKAVNGGGGRGMRAVVQAEDLEQAIDSARREAKAAFGSDRLLLERLVERPRHVEVQVFGDTHGNVVHLHERDCTLQRRNQKVVEEAPAPGLSPGLRKKLHEAAVTLARAARYTNAGTCEFLIEGGRQDARAPYYFIEMNTRLQVEHPVTEAITGLDLVEWQLRVAAGEPLPLQQQEIEIAGHAVELRLNAEDAAAGFLPSTGRLAVCEIDEAEGLRVECGYRTGDVVGPYYDSLIAKLIATAPTREEALSRLQAVLESHCNVAGVRTNGRLLASLIDHPDVRASRMDTGFIGRELEALAQSRVGAGEIEKAVAAVLAHDARQLASQQSRSPWSATDGFELGPARRQNLSFAIDGKLRGFEAMWQQGAAAPDVRLLDGEDAHRGQQRPIRPSFDNRRAFVLCGPDQIEIAWPEHARAGAAGGESDNIVRAPITGRVVKVHVSAGARIDKGARLVVIEAMKMEHVLTAPRAGRIARLEAHDGAQVAAGTLLVEIGDDEA